MAAWNRCALLLVVLLGHLGLVGLVGLVGGCAARPGHPFIVVTIPPAPPLTATPRDAAAPTNDEAEEPAGRRTMLAGVRIRIVHTARRTADAETAGKRLRALGADIQIFQTSDSGNDGHMGRLYVKRGFEKYAREICRVVASIEVVTPVPTDDGSAFADKQQFNLWVAK